MAKHKTFVYLSYLFDFKGSCESPFLIVDALVVKVRRDGAVRPTGVLIIYGIDEEGTR